MDNLEIDSVPAIFASMFDEEEGVPLHRRISGVEDSGQYIRYRLADLQDGTFLEIPRGNIGLLLNNAPVGSYSIDFAAWMRYQSYFLGTANVEGTSYRVLWGVFGDNKGVDSFVLTDDYIVCKIIPSAATHPNN